MTSVYRLDPRLRPQLLFAMMKLLAGERSRIAFEGNLSSSGLFRLEGASFEANGMLKRATLAPRLDYVILPLAQARIAEIEKAIHSKIAFDGCKGIIHVQIESEGEIAFAAYDNFSRDCVVVNAMVPTTVLDDLVEARILRGYSPVAG
jgi:hypothetical protein